MTKKAIVIGISGTTNSGKSTLANQLVTEIPNSIHMYQDHYFLPPGDSKLAPIYIPELDHHNWEDYRALEMDKLVDDLKQKIKTAGEKYHTTVILIDGFSIFGWRPLENYFDKKYFLQVDRQTCYERRQKRTYDPPDVPGYFEQYAWPKHVEHMNAIADQHDIEYFEQEETMDQMIKKISQDVNELMNKH